jgi:mannose-6-phosphate isomerase-like protein (cupin superfamily)
MSFFVNRRDVQAITAPGHTGYPLLNESHGCVAGFKSGITIYTATEYGPAGVHGDQEGFVVMDGTGWVKVGDEEQHVEPDTCFIAPAGVAHSIKRDSTSPHIKVCWFHGAIT